MLVDDTQNLPDVTDDDPNETDDDDSELDTTPAADIQDDEGGDGDVDFEALLTGAHKDDADTDEGDKGDKSPAPAAKQDTAPAVDKAAEPPAKPDDKPQPEPAPPAEEPKFTQADLERIIDQRLGRDRKADAVRQAEAVLGKPLEQFVAEARKGEIEKAQEQYSMTEEEATAFVAQREELADLKAQRADLEARQQELQAITAYQQDKAKHAHEPLAQKYAAEVDAFTGYGKLVPYEDGLTYILGQKLRSGELQETIQRGTEQKTLASVQKRQQAAPETGAPAAAKPAESISRIESALAHNLGLTDKEWIKSKAQGAKTRRQA